MENSNRKSQMLENKKKKRKKKKLTVEFPKISRSK